ncbi:MAG: hypothetical protein DCC67_17490 [Planctomycetota bacterium]|nr:MAG: hypothetical protein DCC67_17490 [Planctomycetota bacterium]
MEEAIPRPGKPGDRAEIAAEKLRALRQRANQALEEHRGRLTQIEAELNSRVRQLAEEFEESSARLAQQSADGRDGEIAALQAQLEEGRRKHERFVEQLALARRQLDAIQAQPCTACQDAANQLALAQSEIGVLRQQLEAADRQGEEDRLRHEKFSEQVAAARAAIAELQSKSGDQAAQLLGELDAARQAKAAAELQLEALARDMELLRAQCEAAHDRAARLEHEHAAALAAQRQEAEAAIANLKQQAADRESEVRIAQQASDSLRQEADSHQATIAALERELDDARRDRDGALAEAARQKTYGEAARTALEAEISKLQSSLGAAQTELAAATSQAADRIRTLAEQLTAAEARGTQLGDRLGAVESQRDEAVHQLTTLQQAAADRESQLEARVADLEAENNLLHLQLATLRDECQAHRQAAQDAQRQLATVGDSEAAVVELQQQLARAKSESAEANRELTKLQSALEATCPRVEFDSLQQKFDLALADVQKLNEKNSRLEEELASRPAASDGEAPELVAMRVERDALAGRVEELENMLAAATETAPSRQETEDLQRRFELAVDDVRQLKQENAQLRQQVAAAKASPAAVGQHSGPLDWAAQKARLLALLEQEEGDGPISAERTKERARIEDAIQATQRAIAEKDRELEELRARALQAAESPSDDSQQRIEEVLDAEPLIAAERARLAELQRQWEEKLRAAELEFALERAKLAREQAALKERMLDFVKLQSQSSAADSEHKPRRRWLAALGLGDDQDEVK